MLRRQPVKRYWYCFKMKKICTVHTLWSSPDRTGSRLLLSPPWRCLPPCCTSLLYSYWASSPPSLLSRPLLRLKATQINALFLLACKLLRNIIYFFNKKTFQGLVPCWEESLVTGGKSETMRETEKGESQLRFYECNRIGVFDSKPLQQMLHETVRGDLPSHLLSKWDAAFLPLPLLPRTEPPSDTKTGRMWVWNQKITSADVFFLSFFRSLIKTITTICIALIIRWVNLVPFIFGPAGFLTRLADGLKGSLSRLSIYFLKLLL